ncbi:hypothetical protein ACQP3F_27625, partial [Escherichia coli]
IIYSFFSLLILATFLSKNFSFILHFITKKMNLFFILHTNPSSLTFPFSCLTASPFPASSIPQRW